jgi:integrase
MEVPSAESKTVCVSQVEFDVLMSYVRNPSLADLLIVTWDTGCRPQESLRVESRHVDVANQRWVIPKSESKMKRMTRVVYLTERGMQITRRLMLAHPEGPLFRNRNGNPWTTEAVNCCFFDLQMRMGKEEMKRRGEEIPEEEIVNFIPNLNPVINRKGVPVPKNPAELRCEAKRKLTFRQAAKLAPRYSLYALRHSWATNALQRGVDPLTVAILMGHEDPSTLAKVYQHLSLNPKHLLEEARRAAG